MKNNAHIRRATFDDLPAITALIHRILPQLHASGNIQWDERYPSEQTFRNDIADQALWLAETDGQLAGIAAILTTPEPAYAAAGLDPAEPAIVVHRLAVDLAFRGRGLGIALLEQAEAVARETGRTILRLDTSAENMVTQKLFPKLGYRFAGEIALPHRPGLRVFCYEKRLE